MSLPIPFESLLPPASESHIATRSSLWSEALQFIAYVSKILQKSRETASAEKNTLFLHVDEFGMQRNIVGQGAQSKVLIAGGYGANNEGSTPSFSKYALKTTLPSKREDGEVDYMALRRTRFHNALAEIRVLTCPPLATHQSIVTFLGVAWENDEEVGSDQSVHPSIAIEQAEMGSLSEYLNTRSGASEQLDYEVKRSLALCVALGLDVLHESGIVHGDVKPDNVLVFVDTKMPGGVRAKLTDFGHSVFIHENGDLEDSKEAKEFIAPLGTRDWNAPEIRPKVDTTSSQSIYLSANEIFLTDIYSFGLLYWSLLLNGADCFDCIPGVQQAVTAQDLTTRSRLIEQNMEGNFMKHWAYTSVKSFGTWQGSDKDAIYKEEAGHIFDWTLDSLLEERANQLGKLFVSFPDTALQR
jgi:serine/threonine protein kinase